MPSPENRIDVHYVVVGHYVSVTATWGARSFVIGLRRGHPIPSGGTVGDATPCAIRKYCRDLIRLNPHFYEVRDEYEEEHEEEYEENWLDEEDDY